MRLVDHLGYYLDGANTPPQHERRDLRSMSTMTAAETIGGCRDAAASGTAHRRPGGRWRRSRSTKTIVPPTRSDHTVNSVTEKREPAYSIATNHRLLLSDDNARMRNADSVI